jgi:hypothetical protein
VFNCIHIAREHVRLLEVQRARSATTGWEALDDRTWADLVRRWTEGDRTAFDRIVELLYDELRAIAHRHLQAERPDPSGGGGRSSSLSFPE